MQIWRMIIKSIVKANGESMVTRFQLLKVVTVYRLIVILNLVQIKLTLLVIPQIGHKDQSTSIFPPHHIGRRPLIQTLKHSSWMELMGRKLQLHSKVIVLKDLLDQGRENK